MFAFALLAMAIWLWNDQLYCGSPAQMRDLMESLATIDRALLGGALSWRAALSIPCVEAKLGLALDSAQLDGQPVRRSIAALRHVLKQEEGIFKEIQGLRRLLLGRASGACVVVLLIRVAVLGPKSAFLNLGLSDGAIQVFAAACYFLPQLMLRQTLPQSNFFGQQGMTELGSAWFAAHLDLAWGETGAWPWCSRLVALDDLALRQGVSTLAARREALCQWAEAQANQCLERVQFIADCLPLYELGATGLPAALLMLKPISLSLAPLL